MKFKTTSAARMATTAKVPEYVVRSDREIASLVARFKPLAVAHAKAKVAATQSSVMLSNIRDLVAKLRRPASAMTKELPTPPAASKTRHVVSILGKASYERN